MSSAKKLTIKQAISRAKKAIKQGDTATAIQLFTMVYQHDPNHPIAKKGLRKLQKAGSSKQPSQAKLIDPPSEQVNALLQLHETGQNEKTGQLCRKLLDVYPKSLIVINVYGITLLNQNKSQEAVAAFNTAIELKPDYADAYNNRGNALRNLGRLEEAVSSYDHAITHMPTLASAHSNRGYTLRDLGKITEALKSFEIAIELKVDYAEAYFGYATALYKSERFNEALLSYENAIKSRHDYADAYLYSGVVLYKLGQMDEALQRYEKAIKIQPDNSNAYYNYANLLQDLGRFSDALKNYEKAVEIKPDHIDAHRNITPLKTYCRGDSQITILEHLYADLKTSEHDRMILCFSLAKIYEDLSDYDKSFHFIEEGNTIRCNDLKYSIDKDRSEFSTIKNIFTADDITNVAAPFIESSKQPIFIVGMPRSGTTLVEQILSSHSTVYGAGELTTMEQLVNSVLDNLTIDSENQNEHKLTQNTIKQIRDDYLGVLDSLSVSEKIITDKLPLNFRLIGFILSAFPRAKIINLQRDSRATCWSIYKHCFTTTGNSYAYNQHDLAKFYNLYIDLMEFWRERYAESIYDICYEDLTENQEEETRKLLAFCDLAWEPQCIDFHENKRHAKTASFSQVRKKMYQGSSENWKIYEEHLQPLIHSLQHSS